MKLYQRLADQIGEIIDAEFGIMEKTGLILGCTNEERVGSFHPCASLALNTEEAYFIAEEATFLKIFGKNKLESIIWINSTDDEIRKLLSLISINVVNIRSFHEEKFDRNTFVRSMILEQIQASEASGIAKELHVSFAVPRAVYLIRTPEVQDYDVYNVLNSLFPNRTKDSVVAIDEKNIVLVKEMKQNEDCREMGKLAKTIIDTLNTELMIKAQVGIGGTTSNLNELAQAYKNAEIALEIGNIFDKEKTVMDYSRLGIGRLLHHLPENLCKMFLKEVLEEGFFETIDSETLLTVQKLFENNLNISEASRQLYVHRNTLVYRLDKVQKSTGLDLRSFEDAITFKLCLMVKKYLDNKFAGEC